MIGMDRALLERLLPITPEEEALLQGQGKLNRQLYTGARDFVVESRRLLPSSQLIEMRPHTRFVHFPKHKHNFVEILYVCQGELINLINGQERVALQAGELLFLNQNSFHEILPARQTDLAVNFIVLPQFFDGALSLLGRGNLLGDFLVSTLRQSTGEGQYLYFRVADVPTVQNLVQNLVWSMVQYPGGRGQLDQQTMQLLLLELLECADHLDPGVAQRGGNATVMATLRYIEEHYREGSLTELAQQLGVPDYTLSRTVRRAMGVTFQELLQKKRLARATQLLRDTTLPIADIIAAAGYDNTSYFYRIFRQSFSMTPKEYRDFIQRQGCK